MRDRSEAAPSRNINISVRARRHAMGFHISFTCVASATCVLSPNRQTDSTNREPFKVFPSASERAAFTKRRPEEDRVGDSASPSSLPSPMSFLYFSLFDAAVFGDRDSGLTADARATSLSPD